MSYINEMGIDSPVVMKYKFPNGELKQNTVITGTVEDRYGRGITCSCLVHDGKILNCTNGLVSVTVVDNITGREFLFRPVTAVNLPNKENLVIHCDSEAEPENNRSAYRVVCGYRCEIRVGDNRGVVTGTVKDVSYTGLGCIIIPSSYQIVEGNKVSCSIITDGGTVIKAVGTVMRNDENNEKTRIIGIQFDELYSSIQKLVSALQRAELAHRQGR